MVVILLLSFQFYYFIQFFFISVASAISLFFWPISTPLIILIKRKTNVSLINYHDCMLSRWVGRLIIINTLIVFVRNCENYSVNKKITRRKNHASQKQVSKTVLEIAKFNKHSQGIQDLSTADEQVLLQLSVDCQVRCIRSMIFARLFSWCKHVNSLILSKSCINS